MNLIPKKNRVDRKSGLQVTSEEPWSEDFFARFWDLLDGRRDRLPALFRQQTVPPMNVAESEDHYAIELELPGMEAKDIDIELMGNQLQISGERSWEAEKKGKEYHRVESQYGSFFRSLTLPENARLDRDAVRATFKKGVLEIRVPKREPTPATRVAIAAE